MLNRLFFFILAIAQFGSLQASFAEDSGTPAIVKPLFADDTVLDLSLSVDFDAMCRPNYDEDCQYTPTTLTYSSADGVEQIIPVEIRVRGGWRARTDNCQVPPLFVRFGLGQTEDTPFAGQGLLPLTTHCRSSKKIVGIGTSVSSKEYEQYVLKEYLGYRIYNLLNEKSLYVRMARITYTRPDKSDNPITRFAFFTEHFDDMAARHFLERLSDKSFDYEKVDLHTFDQLALYNFMIGNTDWSVVRDRNILLVSAEDGRQYPVPFDLDMSGLVSAEYSGVSPRLDFRDPRQRYYLGFCHPETDFDSLFAEFQGKKEEIILLVGDTPGLRRSEAKKSRSYLKKFFSILESPELRRVAISEACHPWPPSPEDHTTPPDAT